MNMRQIKLIDGLYYLEGSSQQFNSIAEIKAHVKSMSKKKKEGKTIDGRRFWSERLQMPFRSNWEIELAELMTELGIEWLYEPERVYFKAERESYLPDFYLPDYDVWIEVKGWMDNRSEKRCRLFRKYHGNETGFFLYMKEERESILKKPELLFECLKVAQIEMQLRQIEEEES